MENNNKKTPEEIEKELSVGNFAADQAKTMGLTFGGAGAGYLAGMGLAQTKVADSITKKIPSINSVGGVKGAAAFVGLIIGSIASGYSHWKKVERERKGVEEINKDVASVMEKRAQFEETLDKQSEFVKKLVAERSNATAAAPAHGV